jgi:putative holliday junction resolvase
MIPMIPDKTPSQAAPQTADDESAKRADSLVEVEFPQTGRLLGVDFGTVRIGISVCDPMRILASPLEIRPVSDKPSDAKYFCALAKKEAASGFVVGLPIHCDGGESEKSREARAFAVWLRDVTGLPVRLFDERFTTSAAQQRMREGQKKKKTSRIRQIDAIAAQVLLESFLEAARYRGETPGQSPSQAAEGDASLD